MASVDPVSDSTRRLISVVLVVIALGASCASEDLPLLGDTPPTALPDIPEFDGVPAGVFDADGNFATSTPVVPTVPPGEPTPTPRPTVGQNVDLESVCADETTNVVFFSNTASLYRMTAVMERFPQARQYLFCTEAEQLRGGGPFESGYRCISGLADAFREALESSPFIINEEELVPPPDTEVCIPDT